MKWYKSKGSVIGLILLGLFARCKEAPKYNSRVEALPYYGEATFTPKWFGQGTELEKGFHQIPAFTLIDQTGTEITEKTFADKIYVADFFFTSCPGICKKMTANMSVLQEEFKTDDEIMLLSHSVTPEIDSVAQLARYAKENEVNAHKWHLVTGNRDVIYDLGRNHYFVEENLGREKSVDEFLHTENFVLIDKERHIRGIYNGLNKTAIKQLITDIHTLKSEYEDL